MCTGAARDGHGMVIILEGEDVTEAIRNETVGAGASQVAALPVVRTALLQRQKAFREAPGLPTGATWEPSCSPMRR